MDTQYGEHTNNNRPGETTGVQGNGSEPTHLNGSGAGAKSDGAAAAHLLQDGFQAIVRQARAVSTRMSEATGASGMHFERLAENTNTNLKTATASGEVLIQAYKAASKQFFSLLTNHWKRSVDGLERLNGAKSLQDLLFVQGDLARDGIAGIMRDGQAIVETSSTAFAESSRRLAATQVDAGPHAS